MSIMVEQVPKLDDLLSHRPLGRILEMDGIAAEFALIKRAFEAAKKPAPAAQDFRRVGEGSGTHLLKLNSSRTPIGQNVLRFVDQAANRLPEVFPSIDAKKSLHCKLVFRPLEVSGHPTRSLADHILNPDDAVSPKVIKGFGEAFGEDALDALREALTRPLGVIKSLPAAEFPIIFLPRPGGGDLQATPIAPAEAYVRFREVTEPYFCKQEDDEPRVSRGRWRRQFVADKPQNISSAVGKQRTRFFASMPSVLDQWSAELHRYANGGRFPMWRDDGVVDAVEAYANLCDKSADYSNIDIRKGLDRRAERLILAAQDFIEETLADAKREFPNVDLPDPPPVATIILRRRWPRNSFDRARGVLSGERFKARLKVVGVS